MILRVAFTGGGTGGHIYPALAIDGALREEYRADAYEARFFGNRNGLEAKLVTAMPLAFVPSAPLVRSRSLAALRTLALNLAGIVVALIALARFRPLVVVATGGYVCFPVVVAARLLALVGVVRGGIFLLEPNAAPGLTNRLLAPLVDEVWTSFAAPVAAFGRKQVVTGAPTRASLRALRDPGDARMRLDLDPLRTTIVVMGGSQGARSINEAVTALVTRRTLPSDWQVLHVCGERDYAYMLAEQRDVPFGNLVRLVPYLPDPADAYAAADIVVARAGASTLAELAVTGTPALLIPYPHAADDHQRRNAEAHGAAGAADVLDDVRVDGDALWWALSAALAPDRRTAMRAAARSLAGHDATRTIVDRIERRLPARVAHDTAPNGSRP